jgi:pyruvate dehydrogenase E1 component alpha subunit
MSLEKTEHFEMYRRMQRIRCFEEAVKTLEVEGHLSIGQEGAIVGACMALRDDDFITGTHRSHGHPIGKGAKLKPLMAELLGKATGICGGRGGSMHLADFSVGVVGESAIVGGGIPLATGAGFSAQVRGTDQVSLCFFGDGASNQGTFGESMNLAAVWKLPVIFFCENNGYAISTSVEKSHGQPDIAKRADGYGMPGVIVDGQDALAVYRVTNDAVIRARKGDGPTLIEAKTYRFEEHCDNLNILIPYRSQEEINHHVTTRDPIDIYQASLLAMQKVTQRDLDTITSEVKLEVDAAVKFAQESAFPDPADIYQNMYSSPIDYSA